MTDAQQALFVQIHADLPQQGPGDEASTRRALRLVADRLPAAPRVLDLGCGTGRQTLALASQLDGEIVAVDTHRPYLDRLAAQIQSPPPRADVRPVEADLHDLLDALGPAAKEPFDLIWAEGSLYILGLKVALSTIHPLLHPEGCLAFTELTWLTAEPSDEARAFWAAEYPALQTAAANRTLVRDAGFDIIGDFVLPEASWWDGYYRPIEEHLGRLRDEHADVPELLEVIAATQAEIDLYRAHAAEYGYVIYVAQKRPA